MNSSDSASNPGGNSTHGPDSLVFKMDRPWPNARMRVGAIVGHTTPQSVRMWFRTGSPGRFTLVLYDCAAAMDSKELRAELRTRLGTVPMSADDAGEAVGALRRVAFTIEDYSSDTTHVVDLSELDPDTRYGYVLYSGGDGGKVILGHNRLRSFRTPPAEDAMAGFQIALFSCHMPFRVSGLFRKRTHTDQMDVWDFMDETLGRHRDSVDVVIAGGDQAYSDGVDTLNIWKLLNRAMRLEDDELLPAEDDMVTWFRDIYRGYWGFDEVRKVFDSYPTYMIWDDHEIADGWGSHYLDDDGPHDSLNEILPDLEAKQLTRDHGRRLVQRMFRAACRVYGEYQHGHNPPTDEGVWDYSFRRGGAAFYVLDGRGHRDIGRDTHRILGQEQFERFAAWADVLDPADTPFLFVVSAVPVIHAKAGLVDADLNALLRRKGLGDDLRDAWEHSLHDGERAALMDVLFRASGRGIRTCILSGDVHVSAAFSIDDEEGHRVWQLTSSAVTQNVPPLLGWVLTKGAADEGTTEEGHRFRRLALYTGSSYALVELDPQTGGAWFKLYGKQVIEHHTGEKYPFSHSVAKIQLFGEDK